MTRGEARTLALLIWALLVSGIAVAVSKRWLTPSDPFSAVSTPWEPWALKLHILAAPALLFVLGRIYRRHVTAKAREAAGRISGHGLLLTLAGLTGTGYLHQVASGEGLRALLSWGHLVLGVLFGAGWIAHLRLKAAPESTLAAAGRAPWRRQLDRLFPRRP